MGSAVRNENCQECVSSGGAVPGGAGPLWKTSGSMRLSMEPAIAAKKGSAGTEATGFQTEIVLEPRK